MANYHVVHNKRWSAHYPCNLGESMDSYEVMIKATITKSVVVDASNIQEAEELAHHMWSWTSDGPDEKYEQEAIGSTQLIK